MKALNIHELRTFAQNVRERLQNSRLQEVLVNDRGLALGFFQTGMQWLVIDLVQATPMTLLFADAPPFQKSTKSKPVALFLRAHALNLYFDSCEVLEAWGRVLCLKISQGDRLCEIEIQLVPKQVNLIVRTQGKAISWQKIKALKPALEVAEMEERSLRQIHTEWLEAQKKPQQGTAQDPVVQWEAQRQKDIQKKMRAITEIEKTLQDEKSADLFSLGEYLKTQGLRELPLAWQNLVDTQKTLSWNLENIFTRAKRTEQKRAGTLVRLEILRQEIEKLQTARFQAKTKSQKLDDLMAKTSAKGRKCTLDCGAVVYCGKSAADNLSLLRQAKAWDYWLHLKDFPGAHAILHRQRDQVIPEPDLRRAATWLAQESLASKSLLHGEKLAVVLAECRFVKPIKGDKIGRVTYHSERHLVITYE